MSVARALSIGLLAFGTGWIRGDQVWRVRQRDHERLLAYAGERVRATGHVADLPAHSTRNGRPRRTFRVALETIGDAEGESHACAGEAIVVAHGPPPRAGPTAYGQRWQWEGRLVHAPFLADAAESESRLRATRAPGRYWLHVGPAGQRRLDEARGWRAAAQTLLRGRALAAERIGLGVAGREEAVGLVRALLLGERAGIASGRRELFSATGSWHVFAISGLHVGILVLLLATALRMAGVSRERWIWFLAPALAAYVWATGARASAIRAGLMASFYFLAPALNRKPDALSALALTAGLILAAAPGQLFELGFLYSFVVTAGLMALFPPFHEAVCQAFPGKRYDTILPERKPKGWLGLAQDTGAGARRGAQSLAALSLAAWVASAPLASHWFGQFTPVALIANLWAVPMVFLIVLCGGLSLTLGLILPILADIFNHANVALAHLLTSGLAALRALPGGHWEGWHAPTSAVAGWYGFWLAFALVRHGRQPLPQAEGLSEKGLTP